MLDTVLAALSMLSTLHSTLKNYTHIAADGKKIKLAITPLLLHRKSRDSFPVHPSPMSRVE